MILPRFYPILDTALFARSGLDILSAADLILQGGARILQFRHKAHFSRDIFSQAERISKLCHEAGALFVVNDRADVAMLLDAALHIGQDDLPAELARRLVGNHRILGYSTHNEGQLLAASKEPIDYAALGPVFGTSSKENPDPTVGLSEFRRLRALTAHPLVAIGGITRANARDVIRAGADAVAIIGDLVPNPCTPAALRARTEEWLRLLAL